MNARKELIKQQKRIVHWKFAVFVILGVKDARIERITVNHVRLVIICMRIIVLLLVRMVIMLKLIQENALYVIKHAKLVLEGLVIIV